MGVAEVLSACRSQLHGTVKLIFQPAEEGVRGARSIVEQGHLDGVDYVLGAHMKRIEEEVREAARQADVVLVSIHAHETDRDDFTVPSESLQIFSRRCIDAGASAVLGHGPHDGS